ncbi:MAG: GreA/GreB family elongation factor, partial [Planctomycetes bacterium]|nr:GreA/GreB family elongation factor [Planctomycetota bacterium]
KLKAASKMLEKLNSGHFLVWKKTRLEELRELCKSNQVEVVKMILESEKIEISQKDIKARIVPDILANKEWNKFLHKLKKDALTDVHLQISSGGNPKYTVTEEAKHYEDVALNKFKRAQGWQEKLVLGYDAFANTVDYDHNPAFLEEISDFFTKLIEQNVETKGTPIIGAVMLLSEIQSKFEKLQIVLPITIEDCFDENDEIEQIIDSIAKLQISAFQKKLFKNLKTWYEKKWDDILYSCFFKTSQTLWEESMKVCDKDNKIEIFEKAGNELILNYDKYPENFIWYVKQIFSKAKKNVARAGEVYHLFDLLLNLAFRLHHSQLRGDKQAKASLTKLKNLVADPKLSLLKFLLNNIKEAEADHLYNHVNRTEVLGEIAKTKLKSEIKNAFKQFKQKSITRALPMIDESKLYITPTGLEKLTKIVKKIESDEIPAIQKAIGAALELGDISENAELDAARERDIQTKQRLQALREDLKNHVLLEAENISNATVAIGTKVTFNQVGTDIEEFLTIVGCTWDIDVENMIVSYNSPLALAMLGAQKGDEIPVPAKEGIRKICVNKIEVGLTE